MVLFFQSLLSMIVGAEICSWNSRQAAVREEMRGKDIGEDEDRESDQKSEERIPGGRHIRMVSFCFFAYSFW
jgi:hypothetical protein